MKRRSFNALWAVVVVFWASRLLFWAWGVRFDTSSLGWYWQYLDPALLTQRLGESLFYLHSQPPLFNLLLGVGLQWFPHHAPLAFHLLYLGASFALTLAMFALLTRLGGSAWLSAAVTMLVTTGPAYILYENWLFYDYAVAVLFGLAAWALYCFEISGKIWAVQLFFLLLGGIALTRSAFHLVWFAFWLGALLLARRSAWKKILAAGALPLLLILGVYTKNLLVFGMFASSSWLGLNFSHVTTFQLPVAERVKLVEQGDLSPFALIPAFSCIDQYRAQIEMPARTGQPALDDELKTSGACNFNQRAFLTISRQYWCDGLTVLRMYPAAYLHALAKSFARYVTSPVLYPAFFDNVMRIPNIFLFYNATLYASGTTLIGFILAVSYGLFAMLRPAACGIAAHRLTLLFVWGNLVYVTFVGNMLEVSENNRFRMMIDPLLTIIIGLLFAHVLREFARRRRKVNTLEHTAA